MQKFGIFINEVETKTRFLFHRKGANYHKDPIIGFLKYYYKTPYIAPKVPNTEEKIFHLSFQASKYKCNFSVIYFAHQNLF
jgi:hypothetical protein